MRHFHILPCIIMLMLLFSGPVLAQDSLNMRRLGHLWEHGWANSRHLVVVDSLLYLTTGYTGMSVLSIGNPTDPSEVGFCAVWAVRVVVRGSYAYVTGGSALRVINIANPNLPVEVGSCPIPGAEGVAVRGDYAYVTRNLGGLSVIDVSNPATPAEVCFHAMPSRLYNVVLSGDYAFVANGDRGLCVLDVSDPVNPVELGCCDTPDLPFDLAIAGNYAYVTDRNGGLRIINVANPAAPFEVSFLNPEGMACGVAISGQYAYFADGGSGLRIINIADPVHPSQTGHIDTPNTAYGVVVQQNFAYIADDQAGLRVIDVSDPALPVEIGVENPLNYGTSIAMLGDFAYVANGGMDLRTILVQDPSHPVVLGYNYEQGGLLDLTVSGDHLYAVSLIPYVLRVFDVSVPQNPVSIGVWAAPSRVRGVAVLGSLACLATEMSGLRVIDVSDPSHPGELGFYDPPGYEYYIKVKMNGNNAYVASREGLRVFDLSSPNLPVLAGTFDTQPAEDIDIAGGYAYLMRASSPWDSLHCVLSILDVSNLTQITELGNIRIPGDAASVSVVDHYAFVVAQWGGTHVIDVLDASHPVETGFYRPSGAYDGYYAMDVAATQGVAYVVQRMDFSILDCSVATSVSMGTRVIPTQPLLRAAYPNPFNPVTTLQLDLPNVVRGRLVVYDLLGRKVATLLDGVLWAGSHEVNFNAEGLSSGSYFVRFESPTIAASQEITLLK